MDSPLSRYDPGPQILYCCVAYQKTVLAEYFDVSLPGVDIIVKQILSKTTNGKNVLNHEKLRFCLLTVDMTTIISITGQSFPQERTFDFIDEVIVNFSKLYNPNQLDTLTERSLTKTFAPMMKQKINHYNDLTNDPLDKIQETLDLSVEKVNENVNALLNRGTALNNLEHESVLMLNGTEDMYSSSIELKKKFKTKNLRLYIATASLIVIVIAIIVWSFCGLRFQRC
ncbi:Vesicle-associated membrane protein [Entamoeba marina]